MTTTEPRTGLLVPTRKLDIGYTDKDHSYTLDGEPVPSVTKIIGGLMDKPGLNWWAFRIGMAAAVELVRDGKLSYAELISHDSFEEIVNGTPTPINAVPPKRAGGKPKTKIEHLAIANKLDPNNVRDAAARRGDGTHDALATLQLGDVPKVDELPERHRPFVHGLLKWWLDQEPHFEFVEHLVGHTELRYAGRYDMLYTAKDEALVLADIKTSKDPHLDTWSRQLEAYRLAWEHMGGAPPDRTEVILCRPDGTYQVYPTRCNPEAWTTFVHAYHADVAWRELQKQPWPQAPEIPEDQPELEGTP